MNYGLGWIPDVPDIRDFKFSAPAEVLEALPREVDLRPKCPPVLNQGNLGSCHDGETEVLTDAGWKLFADVASADRLASVDPVSGRMIFERPTKLIRFHYEGAAYKSKHRSLDFVVTPNHKMLVRPWIERDRTLSDSYSLIEMESIGWCVGLMNSVKYLGEVESDSYLIKGIPNAKHTTSRQDVEYPMEQWLKLLGYYIADGTMLKSKVTVTTNGVAKEKNRFAVQLASPEGRKKDFIKPVLESLGIRYTEFDDRIVFQSQRIYYAMMELGLCGVKAPEKFVPSFVFRLSGEQIKHFLDGYFRGDGCEQDGSVSYYSSSKQLSDDVQILVLMSGGWAVAGSREPRESVMKDGRIVKGRHPEHRVGQWRGMNLSLIRKKNIEQVDYNGEVFCAEVPTYHTLITRRNGKMLISGNCVYNATSNAHRFNQIAQGVRDNFLPSRLFGYYCGRDYEGTIDVDAGSQIRTGIKVLAKRGAIPESLWPYQPSRFRNRPPAECYAKALDHQAIRYERVNQTRESIQSALASGFPVSFGTMIYGPFQDVSKNVPIVPFPSRTQKRLGGHAMLIVGYDPDYYLVMNSWGTGWGRDGFCLFHHAYLENDDLSADFWVVRLVEAPNAPDPTPAPEPAEKWDGSEIEVGGAKVHFPAKAGDQISLGW